MLSISTKAQNIHVKIVVYYINVKPFLSNLVRPKRCLWLKIP